MQKNSAKILPKLVVFDLDMCLWSPEMYELSKIPTQKIQGELGTSGKGVVGLKSGSEVIKLFPAVITILQDFHNDKYPGMKLALASSAPTSLAVQLAQTSLSMLEILPGVSMRQVIQKGWDENFEGHIQIGRSKPLTSDKSKSHFPIIQQNTGIPYADMLFFDDSNWEDNCAQVERNCPGVVAQRTPRGLQINEWYQALEKYQKKYGTATKNIGQ